MVLAETIGYIFIFIISSVCLYMGFKRNALVWFFVSTIFYSGNAVYAMTIPFTTSGGLVVASSANFVLSVASWFFMFVSFLFLVKMIFEFFDIGKKLKSAF